MKLAAALVACAGLAACHPTARPCAPGTPAKIELRDGSGALLAAVRPAPEGSALKLCTGDNATTLSGQVISDGKTITLLDASQSLALRLSATSPGDAQGAGPHGARLRVHRQGEAVRVLKPDGSTSSTPTAGSIRGASEAAPVIASTSCSPRDTERAVRVPLGIASATSTR